MRTRAAPHPKACADSYGCEANLHILKGNASTGPVRLVKNRLVPSIVIIRGAVSPAILDIAKITPVSTPSLAFLRTIKRVIFDFEIPREYPASRSELGTNFSVSSVTLDIIGIIIIERAKAPAHTENEFIARTIVTYPTIPITIEGNPVRTSLNSLIVLAKKLIALSLPPFGLPAGAYSDR